jgi:predicted nucleotidyltransferase
VKKELTVEFFKIAFNNSVVPVVGTLIDSYYLFGGLARGEQFSTVSDIDTVLLLKYDKEVPYASISKLNSALQGFHKEIGVSIDNVVVTSEDIFELLSPVLIQNMYNDGVVIYGRDLKTELKQYLASQTERDILNSHLTRVVFRRHLVRKKMLHMKMGEFVNNLDLMTKEIESMSKDVLFTARDFILFKTKDYITKRELIGQRFKEIDSSVYNNFPYRAFKLKDGIVSISTKAGFLKYINLCFSFMEDYTEKIINLYKRRTGEDKLNLKTF